MTDTSRAKPRVLKDGDTEIEIRPLDPKRAEIWRLICTAMEIHRNCPFKACRRMKRCATRDVLCYQVLRRELNRLILPALKARRDGRPMPPWPKTRAEWDACFAGDDAWPPTSRTGPDEPPAQPIDPGAGVAYRQPKVK